MTSGKRDSEYVCTLSDELIKIAREELNEIPEKRSADIDTLRKRIHKHPGLNICTDDAYLLKFLRASAFDQDAAYSLVVKYFEMKADEMNKQMFTNLRSNAVKHVVEAGVMGILPGRDKKGRKIFLSRGGRWDVNNLDVEDMFKTGMMMCLKLAEDEDVQIRGVTVLYDMQGIGFGHLTHASPFYAKRKARFIEESLPLRFKMVHVVNEPTVFDYLLAIGRPFMSQETLDKIRVHGHKLEELTEFFDLDQLPQDYGGTGPPVSDEELGKSILNCDADFDAEAKNALITDIPKDTTFAGMPGKYRKLDI